MPSPFSQAGGSGTAGGDFFSGDDVLYRFRVKQELRKGEYFEVFYKNSDGNAHSISINYELEDIKPKKIMIARKDRDKRLANVILENIMNALRKISGKPEAKVFEEPHEPEPEPIDEKAYYEYDENNEPELL